MHLNWITQNLADVPEWEEWLGTREREVLSGLHFTKRRNDWRLGRWTTKCAVSACLTDPIANFDQIEIVAAEDGAPDLYYAGGERAPVSLSISHSNGRGFSVVIERHRPVGCDIERIETKSLDFFHDYFTEEEISFCRSVAKDMYPVACYLIWSAKESSLKVLREGLRRDTRSIQIKAAFPAEEGSWSAWTGHCLITSKTFHGWWRYHEGFMYALGSDQANGMPKMLTL